MEGEFCYLCLRNGQNAESPSVYVSRITLPFPPASALMLCLVLDTVSRARFPLRIRQSYGRSKTFPSRPH